MNILEKIKAEHAQLLAREEEKRRAEAERVAADLARRAAPIKARLASWVEYHVLAEEFGDDAPDVFRAFAVEHERDADLLDEHAARYRVGLIRDGLAPIRVYLSREDLAPVVQRAHGPYGVDREGIWEVAGLYVDAQGRIQDAQDFEAVFICASFAEAVVEAEWQFGIAKGEADRRLARKSAPPKPDDGGTAFPSGEDQTEGMRLRDYFAGQAMVGFQMHVKGGWCGVMPADTLTTVAANSYAIADAMLKARKGS